MGQAHVKKKSAETLSEGMEYVLISPLGAELIWWRCGGGWESLIDENVSRKGTPSQGGHKQAHSLSAPFA